MRKLLLILLLPVLVFAKGSSDHQIKTPNNIRLEAGIGVQSTSDLTIEKQNEIRLEDLLGSFYIGFKSPAVLTGTQIFELPDGDGALDQVLSTNGSGVLDWINFPSFFTPTNDNRLVRTDIAGDIQESGITVDDTDGISGVTGISLIGTSLINLTEIAEPSTPAANLARLYFDLTEKKIASKDDAGNVVIYGTGGGGGSGDGINGFETTDNPDAELELIKWTASAGTFAFTTTDPLQGVNSFEWTPAAQNDTLQTDLKDFDKSTFRGRACQAEVLYTGGDENLTLKVMNGLGTVLGSTELPAHTIAGLESVFFLCPNAASIADNVLNGDLRVRLENTGASASVLIKFDSVYLGTLKGLVETILPDVFSARVTVAGVVTSENTDWIDGNCTVGGTGNITCTYNAGLVTVPMSCHGIGEVFRSYAVTSVTSVTQVSIDTYNSAGASTGVDINLICQKQGADAKQSVQIYKNIPKVIDNVNTIGAKFFSGGGGGITSQSVQFVTSFVYGSVGSYTVNFDAGVFTVAPAVTVSSNGSSNGWCYTSSVTTASMNLLCRNTVSDAVFDLSPEIIVTKQGIDYKTPTVQPILVNQVETSFERGITTESCRVDNAGTATIANQSELCDWIASVNRFSAGQVTVTFTAGTFIDEPVCSATPAGNPSSTGVEYNGGGSTVQTNSQDMGGTFADKPYNIKCSGRRQ